MAVNRLRIDGLADLQAALRALPPDLAREGAAIVLATAHAAEDEMRALYPVRDYGARAGRGALVRGLKLRMHADQTGASATVVNTARHAYIFEHGTGPRRWANGKSTGSMPAGRVLIPIALRRRREMLQRLIELVERAGMTVSGGTW